MLIEISYLKNKFNLNINGILHIGAHECEELNAYQNIGISDDKIIWIEGNASIYQKMKDRGIKNIYNALVSDKEEMVSFIITNNGQSSSILELQEHKREHPQVYEIARLPMQTCKMSDYIEKNNINIPFNFINLDIQGAELKALKGMENYLQTDVKYIYTEVNTKHLYKDCCLLEELDNYLADFGFKRVEIKMTYHGWGDAFYIKY